MSLRVARKQAYGRDGAVGGGHRSRAPLGVAVAAALLVACAAYWAGTRTHGVTPMPSTRVREPAVTVPLLREVLIDAVSATGTIATPTSTSVAPLQPTLRDSTALPLITGPTARRGEILKAGALLTTVAEQPVFALPGRLPMYRALHVGDEGPDVSQLQGDLDRLGYDVADARGQFGFSTALAVEYFFRDRGYAAPLKAVYVDTSVTVGSHRRIKRTLVQTAYLPASSIYYLARMPDYVVAVDAHLGDQLSGTLLTVSRGAPVAKLYVDPTVSPTLAPRMPVSLVTEGGSRFNGHVASVTQSSSSGTSIVTAIVDAHSRRLRVGTEVRATIMRGKTTRPEYVLPYSAIQTRPDGANFIAIQTAQGTVAVNVGLGLTANGYVAITIPATKVVHVGDPVVVPQ